MNHAEAAREFERLLDKRFLVNQMAQQPRRNRHGHLPVLCRTKLRIVDRDTQEAFVVTIEEE